MNLLLALPCWQLLPCELINISRGDLDSSNSNHFSRCPLDFLCTFLDILIAYMVHFWIVAVPITSPILASFQCQIIFQSLLFELSCVIPLTPIAHWQDSWFSKKLHGRFGLPYPYPPPWKRPLAPSRQSPAGFNHSFIFLSLILQWYCANPIT